MATLTRRNSLAKTLVVALAAVVSFSGQAAFGLEAPASVSVVSNSEPGTQVNSASAKVTWTSVQDAVAYSVFARAGATSLPGSTPTCQGGECVSIFSDLQGGTEYSFVVSAIDSDGAASSSAPVGLTAISVPSVPRAPIAEASSGQVVLKWGEPSNLGGLSLLDYSISDGGANSITARSSSTSATISGLTNGLSYTFTIRARNSNGYSATASFVAVTPVGIPATPARPTVTSTSDAVTATWVAPNDGGAAISGYDVQLYKSGTLLKTSVAQASATSLTFSTLDVGSYTVKVIAKNSVGSSDPSPSSFTIGVGVVLQSQTITFAAINNQTYPGGITLSATADSGLAVTYGASGACSVNNATKFLSFTASGSCVVTASQIGNSIYAAAADVMRQFQITETVNTALPTVVGGGVASTSPVATSSPTVSPTASPSTSSTSSPTSSPSTSSGNQKISIGTFHGYIAIYLKGYEGQRVSYLVAGKWGLVKSVESNYVRVLRKTGSGYTITTKIYIDRVLVSEKKLVTR